MDQKQARIYARHCDVHKGGGETRTSQNLDHDGLDTSHTPDRVFVAVYPSSVAETDRFRDFNEITNQKMRDAFMANANPAQQAFMRMMGADRA